MYAVMNVVVYDPFPHVYQQQCVNIPYQVLYSTYQTWHDQAGGVPRIARIEGIHDNRDVCSD